MFQNNPCDASEHLKYVDICTFFIFMYFCLFPCNMFSVQILHVFYWECEFRLQAEYLIEQEMTLTKQKHYLVLLSWSI